MIDGSTEGVAQKWQNAAATILLRQTPKNIEVLLVKRSSTMRFMPGSHVFPGGASLSTEIDPKVTAIRELKEETSIHLKDALYFSRWITPSIERKRFAASFFVALLPSNQEVVLQGTEHDTFVWMSPSNALLQVEDLLLPPPQMHNLYVLSAYQSWDEVKFYAAKNGANPMPVLPRLHSLEKVPTLLFPWDEEYSTRGVGDSMEYTQELLFPTSPSRVVRKKNGGWVFCE